MIHFICNVVVILVQGEFSIWMLSYFAVYDKDLFKSLAIRCLKNLKKYLQNNRDMGVVYRLERSIIYI